METLKKIVSRLASNKYFIWVLLAIPLLSLFLEEETSYSSTEVFPEDLFEELMHKTGELATRLLILTLAITPLIKVFGRNIVFDWLKKNRRAFGVACFCYGLVHMITYLLYNNYNTIIEELTTTRITVAWLAMIIMAPLAITSANWAFKKMGGAYWKRLHRLAYVAAVLIFLHLALLEGELGAALVQFGPLFILEVVRIFKVRKPKRIDTTI